MISIKNSFFRVFDMFQAFLKRILKDELKQIFSEECIFKCLLKIWLRI